MQAGDIYHFKPVTLLSPRKGAWPLGLSTSSRTRWWSSGFSRSRVAAPCAQRRWRSAGTALTKETASSLTWATSVLRTWNHIVVVWRLLPPGERLSLDDMLSSALRRFISGSALRATALKSSRPLWWPKGSVTTSEAEGPEFTSVTKAGRGRRWPRWRRLMTRKTGKKIKGWDPAYRDLKPQLLVFRCWVINLICLLEVVTISRPMPPTGREPNCTRSAQWQQPRHQHHVASVYQEQRAI